MGLHQPAPHPTPGRKPPFSAACFLLSVKEFQKLQVVDRDLFYFPPCRLPEGGGGGQAAALSNTLAFMGAIGWARSLAHLLLGVRSPSLLLRGSRSPHRVLSAG